MEGLSSLWREKKFFIIIVSYVFEIKGPLGICLNGGCPDAKFENSKLGRVCCKISNLNCFPMSLSMSIDIMRSIFIVLIDSLFQLLSSPAVTLTDRSLLALISFGFYNCSRNISLLCSTHYQVIISIKKASNSTSIIISYRVAQQLRTPLVILLFEMLLTEWNFIKAYFPDTRTVFPVM